MLVVSGLIHLNHFHCLLRGALPEAGLLACPMPALGRLVEVLSLDDRLMILGLRPLGEVEDSVVVWSFLRCLFVRRR